MVAKSVRFSLICLVVLVVVAQLLTGCDESGQKNPKAEVTQTNASAGNLGPEPGAGVQTAPASEYNCDSTADRSAEKRFWCLGLQAWEDSLRNSGAVRADKSVRDAFIQSWMQGALDASLGQAASEASAPSVDPEAYQVGYTSVLEAQGMLEYTCGGEEETDNEYRDRWCEAAAAYHASQQSETVNVVQRSAYINGYIAGRSVALTLPTTMESWFSGEPPGPDAKRPIEDPASQASRSVKMFHRGFQDGFQGMLSAVRESMDQMMEQMRHLPGGPPADMPGLEGMPGGGR